VIRLKGIVHPKMKILILSSFTHPQVVPNLYTFLCSAKHKGIYLNKSLKQISDLIDNQYFFKPTSQWGQTTVWLPTCLEKKKTSFGTA